MDLEDRIKENISSMQSELDGRVWRLSAAELTLLPAIKQALDEHASGRLLDAGAGNLLFRPVVEEYCESYESLDIIDNPDLDYQQDIQDMELIDNQFDTVFCRNVLEHVPEPEDALEEINRVLNENGTAIITVPHLAYLHNEPHDYYRFTSHLIRYLATSAGFEVKYIRPLGGFFSFVGYAFSSFALGLTYNVPIVFEVVFWMNYLLQKAFVTFDRTTANDHYFPLNYIAVLQKA